jgi:fucose 4-O-acetylase-like acetyltransferase
MLFLFHLQIIFVVSSYLTKHDKKNRSKFTCLKNLKTIFEHFL